MSPRAIVGFSLPDGSRVEEGEQFSDPPKWAVDQGLVDEVPAPTPDAAALAEEEGIDLDEIEGTGKDGRVLKADVEEYLNAQGEEE